MSGGYFQNASIRDLGYDEISGENIDDLIEAVADFDPAIAAEAHAIVEALDAARAKAQEEWERLRGVLKAVEWRRSGDWGDSDVHEAIAKHKASKAVGS